MAMAALFGVIAAGLAEIAVSAFDASRYPVAIGAAALAAWMASLAVGAVRRSRRVR
jgi:hypothetical protein